MSTATVLDEMNDEYVYMSQGCGFLDVSTNDEKLSFKLLCEEYIVAYNKEFPPEEEYD